MKQKHWIRKRVTFTFANGANGAGLIQPEVLPLEGELLHIYQENKANVGAATAQLTIEDVDGFQIFDGTAKAQSTKTDHEFGVAIRRILPGYATLKCTISGDPGAGGYVIEAIIYLIGRDGELRRKAMAVLILLIFALVVSAVLALRVDPPQINLRWIVVICLIGALLAGMPVPGVR